MSVEIYIARHGQNEDNANGILNGHRDLPLTELGRRQAHDLAQGIINTGLAFDAIYSSPLSRAFETAEIVSQVAQQPYPQVMQNLIERDFGVMTGQQTADIEKLCTPDIIKTDIITYFLSPQGAETFPELIVRANAVLKEVRRMHSDGRVLLVCHGDLGKMIYVAATGIPWRDALVNFHFGNGELIDVSDPTNIIKIKLEQFNH